MKPALPGHRFIAHESKVSFIHQRRRLQRVIRPLIPHQVRRHPVEFRVKDVQKLAFQLTVALRHFFQQQWKRRAPPGS